MRDGWKTKVLSPVEREEVIARTIAPRERSGRCPLDGVALKDYIAVREISSGGFATVFAGRNRRDGRPVAIKVLRNELADSEYSRNLFYREIYAVRLIRHPNIVEIHDVGQLGDRRPYYVMDFIEGATLAQWLRNDGPLSPQTAFEALHPVCSALDAAHRAGVIHRDLKCENIMIRRHDGELDVKLLDFGIARLAPVMSYLKAVASGPRFGTPTSIAPEQIRGLPVDARTDVYGVGAILYEVLTGTPPFPGPTSQKFLEQHLFTSPRRPREIVDLPPKLEHVVLRCLEKAPERRFQSVAALDDALAGAVSSGKARKSEPAPEEGLALALYVEIVSADDTGALTESCLDIVSVVIERTQRAIEEAGFQVSVRAMTSLLAVRRLMARDESDEHDERRDFHDFARELHHELRQLLQSHPHIVVQTCVHVDRATVEGGGGNLRLGGSVLSLGTWLPQKPWRGLYVTAAALCEIENALCLGAGPSTQAGYPG